ncbi:SDR family NAD(P)-dependent oxidoreductase [Natronorarus salvus]|uniref:SDR family NAD(P)-dependent oxidoreductase n=1 Tax=Natronorarus salvus TaxID=3117733 RepID=UPI002F26C37E
MDGTTAVVTGASRGVGEAVARALAVEGATVICCSRDGEEIEAVAGSIADSGGSAVGMRADVRDEFDVERLMETAAREGGEGIDLVVANAGVYHGETGETPLGEESYTVFDDTLRTNLRGVFSTIRESLGHLADDARVLVPTGSVAREPKPGIGAYAVSKAGAEAVMRGFAVEDGVAVGCLDLGLVDTDLTGSGGREPEDVAPMFVWAAGLEAGKLNGETLGLREWRRATR